MGCSISYVGVAAQGLSVDSSPDKRLNDHIKSFMVDRKISGLALAIVKNDRVCFAHAYGFKNLDTKEPMTTESIFSMASISKTFTATAVMQLVEKGKISLDDPLIKYLPYLTINDPRYKEITIKQMLTHTSGLTDTDSPKWYKPQYDDGAAERYVRSLTNEKLFGKPGEKYLYSNLAFDILADVIAKVSGSTFEDYIKESILNPLDMKESDFLLKRIKPELRTTPHFRSFTGENEVSPLYPYNRYHAPSACLNANVLEMSHWAIANMNRGAFQGKRILSESSYKLLFEPQAKVNDKISVGLSWFLFRYRDYQATSHSGGTLGFNSYIIMIPEKSLAVVVASNCETNLLGDLTLDITDIMLGIEQK
jgi:CubicO group peptidase (beta-lactamase class C family)